MRRNRSRRCRALLVSLLLLTALAGCQQAAPPASEADIAAVEACTEVWGSDEVERLDELVTEDWVYHVSDGSDMDLPAYKEYIATTRAGFPDVMLSAQQVSAAGDMASARLTFAGTHQGPYLDIAPTGAPVHVEGIGIFRLVDGKIAEQWMVFDSLSMMEQLGVELALPVAVQTGEIKGRQLAHCSTSYTYTYNLYVPTNYDPDESYPLVVNLHGLNMDPAWQEYLSHMTELAQEEAFIVATPLGMGMSWNAGACCGMALEREADDVGFISELIDEVSADYRVDPRRVYVTGFSNGAKLSYRLACELSDRVAAIAPVAGGMVLDTCEPERPVPVLHFHGLTDPSHPFLGGNTGVVNASVPDTIASWREINGCSEETEVIYQQGEVTCKTHKDCSDGATVTLCTVEGGGHTWPGAPSLGEYGHSTEDIDASRTIWEFFEAHPKP